MRSSSPALRRDDEDGHHDSRRVKKRKHRDAENSEEEKGRRSRYDDDDSDKERGRYRSRTLEDGEIVKTEQDGGYGSSDEERYRSNLDQDRHRGSRSHDKDGDRLGSPSPDRKRRSRDRRSSPSPDRKDRSRDRHWDSNSHRDGKGDRLQDRNWRSRGEEDNDSADERRRKHESRRDRNNGVYGKDNSGSAGEASKENGYEEERERRSRHRKDEMSNDQIEKSRSKMDDGKKGDSSSDHRRGRTDRSDSHRRSKKRELSDQRGRKEHEELHAGDSRQEASPRNNDADGTDRKATHNSSAARETNPSAVDDSNAGQLLGRSGGVYIPPFKLAQMMKNIQDKSSDEYQRMTWDALRKSINGLVNKVNASNIKNIIPELLSENLIRGRGLFARSCMKSQMASPSFTHVFAALVAVVNTKFPELGELLLKRVILQFRRALKRNDKPVLLAAAKFIAHLVNQQVAHEVVALEVLMVLLENPTDDSVEVAVGFVKECGAILQDLAPRGLHGIFERFRGILHEGEIDKRVQFMIEGLFAIRKAKFQGYEAVKPELDLVEHEDQFTHEMSLSDDLDAEMKLDVFRADPNFLETEKKYETIKKDILGEDSSVEEEGERDSEASSEDEDDEDDEAEMMRMQIKDETETDLVNLRRTIYLTIMSSVDFEEAGHKLLKIKLQPGQEMELCIMLLECCSQERTYLRYYGLLGQRFCMINKVYQENFDECFVKQYSMIHRLETNKLRNVAKFFAHLLGTDALPWNVLAYIRLTEEDTTSSSRIFIKILFQELSEHLGLRKLNEKLNDPMMQDSFDGIFPKDNPKNTRFAINFFTSIGLGGITDNLREYLKNMPRMIMQLQKPVESDSDSLEGTGTSESESSSDGDSEDSGSGSSSSDATSGSSHSSSSATSDSESDSDSGSDSDSDKTKRRKKRRPRD